MNNTPEYPKSLQERRHPPISLYDTVRVVNGVVKSEHGKGSLFADSEIVQLFPSTKFCKLNAGVRVDILENGKSVIQQQAMRACTAAVAAMLIYDAKKPIDIFSLSRTNLGFTQNIIQWIRDAGLTERITKVKRDMIALCVLIDKYGSAIVDLNRDIGSHVVIVDSIGEAVNLRDPYHGWALSVTKEAFLKGYTGGEIIQLN